MKKLIATAALAVLTIAAAVPAAAFDLAYYKQFCDYATREPMQAIDNCTKIIENSSDPKVLRDAFNQRGRGYLVHGWLDMSLKDFNEVVRIDPKWAVGYHNRALAYRQLGRFQEALADHDRAISMDKSRESFVQARENTLRKMGQ